MPWFLNDLSLWGQFVSVAEFRDAFARFLALRRRSELVRATLYISNEIGARPVVGDMSFMDAVYQTGEQLFRQSILQWLTRQGPFLDEDRQIVEDDYFSFQGYDVTNQGLGEAARRRFANRQAGTFSFVGGKVDCTADPLTVQHGLDDAPIGQIDVANSCSLEDLEARILAGLPSPSSWEALLGRCRIKYGSLAFSDKILGGLRGEPFSAYVCERTFALLDVLHAYMESRLPNGERSPRSHEIVQTHFVGDKAWFSDESETNKISFRNELTFVDPADQTKRIFAPWHGKIKSPQFRIHFEWPISPEVDRIKILYIGPKIAKR